MKRSRFTEEQMIQILKEAEAGAKVKDLVRKHGISEHTFYRWKSKYGGMGLSEAWRLKSLEDENRRLKRAVADLTLDNQALKEALGKSGDGGSETGRRGLPREDLPDEPAPGLPCDRVCPVIVPLRIQAPRRVGAARAPRRAGSRAASVWVPAAL